MDRTYVLFDECLDMHVIEVIEDWDNLQDDDEVPAGATPCTINDYKVVAGGERVESPYLNAVKPVQLQEVDGAFYTGYASLCHAARAYARETYGVGYRGLIAVELDIC